MANETQDMSAVIGGPAEEGSNVVNGSAPGTPGVETQQLGDIFVDDANPGNPVFSMTKTSDTYKAHGIYAPKSSKVPDRFEEPELIKGYGRTQRNQNPMYQTTSSDIGALAPTVHTSHTQFHGRSQAFSNHLGKAGMPCNKSLNTYMDKSKV